MDRIISKGMADGYVCGDQLGRRNEVTILVRSELGVPDGDEHIGAVAVDRPGAVVWSTSPAGAGPARRAQWPRPCPTRVSEAASPPQQLL